MIGTFDAVILVLLILSLAFGFMKGFGKSGPKTIIFLAGILVAVYVGIPIGQAIMKSQFGSITIPSLFAKSIPNTDIFIQDLNGLSLIDANSLIKDGFKQLNFPTFFTGFFLSKVQNYNNTVKDAIASSFSYYTVMIVSFIIFFALTSLIVGLIFKFVIKISFGENGKNIFGRIAGALKYAFKASILFYIVMFIIVLISQVMLKNNAPGFYNYLVTDLKLDNRDSFSLARIFYDYSVSLLNWISAR